MNLDILRKEYELKRNRIKQRLNDFKKFYDEPYSWFYNNGKIELKKVNSNQNERIFEELCFCILTANTSAITGAKSINSIRHLLYNGTLQEIQNKLQEIGYRFPNKRAQYIIEARTFVKNINLKEKLNSLNQEERRDFIVNNFKGIGYKEASHFLRNIGYNDYCILDKHILNSLHEFNIINNIKRPVNKKQYIEIENKMKGFAQEININIDELDLLLWSRKSGDILK